MTLSSVDKCNYLSFESAQRDRRMWRVRILVLTLYTLCRSMPMYMYKHPNKGEHTN